MCWASFTGQSRPTYLVWLISQRAGRCLERLGLLEQDGESAWLELKSADDTDAMPHIMGRAISYRAAVDLQQGQAFMIRTIRPQVSPGSTVVYFLFEVFAAFLKWCLASLATTALGNIGDVDDPEQELSARLSVCAFPHSIA